jgi:putative membrane protein
MSQFAIEKSAKNDKLINLVSLLIPIAVAILIGIQTKLPLGAWTKILPHVIGFINSTTAITLIIGLIAIKNKDISGHRKTMGIAFVQGGLFLILYILYHISNPSTSFGGQGLIRPIYYFLLFSHIGLSIGVVRLVLLAIYHSLSGDFKAHKKVVRWAFPIWLYVSLSGVAVYFLISPYYV